MTQETKALSPPKNTVSQPTVAGLFAGIGGFEIGLHRAGFKTTMLCEIDSYAQEVLEHWKKNTHKDFDKPPFANVDLSQKDITKLKKLPKVTLLTAGFPCQDLSLAGTKAGITGERSGLINEVFRLLESANEDSPDWVLLENVSYMLGLENGKAMRTIVNRFESLGYKWAYRELDARSFGVAQRRKRIFFLATKKKDYEPWRVLFPDLGALKNHTEVTTDIDKHLPEPQKKAKAFGFYWTEGERALGWAVDSVPTIKVGSTLGIPSPPAVWNIHRDKKLGCVIGTPQIEDLEALQGFPRGWTQYISNPRQRWKLIGNAVCSKMSEWIGKQVIKEMNGEFANLSLESAKLTSSKKWPKSACFANVEDNQKYMKINAGSMLANTKHSYDLAETIQLSLKPLSEKATRGYLSRIRKAHEKKKTISEHFVEDVVAHWFYMIHNKKPKNNQYFIPSIDAKRWECYNQKDNKCKDSGTDLHIAKLSSFILHTFLDESSNPTLNVHQKFIYLQKKSFILPQDKKFSPPYVGITASKSQKDSKGFIAKILGISINDCAYDKNLKALCLSLEQIHHRFSQEIKEGLLHWSELKLFLPSKIEEHPK